MDLTRRPAGPLLALGAAAAGVALGVAAAAPALWVIVAGAAVYGVGFGAEHFGHLAPRRPALRRPRAGLRCAACTCWRCAG